MTIEPRTLEATAEPMVEDVDVPQDFKLVLAQQVMGRRLRLDAGGYTPFTSGSCRLLSATHQPASPGSGS